MRRTWPRPNRHLCNMEFPSKPEWLPLFPALCLGNCLSRIRNEALQTILFTFFDLVHFLSRLVLKAAINFSGQGWWRTKESATAPRAIPWPKGPCKEILVGQARPLYFLARQHHNACLRMYTANAINLGDNKTASGRRFHQTGDFSKLWPTWFADTRQQLKRKSH